MNKFSQDDYLSDYLRLSEVYENKEARAKRVKMMNFMIFKR